MRAEVGEFETHLGLEPCSAALLHSPVPRRRTCGLHDPWMPRECGERCAVTDPCGGPARGREPHGVAAQHMPLEVGPVRAREARILFGDCEIEATRRQLEEAFLGGNLGQLDPQSGGALGEERERGGDDRARRRLENGDAHGRDARLQQFEVCADLLVGVESARGVLGERRSVRGQPHATSVGCEERDAGLALEQRELLRDRRGAVGERVGDGGERTPECQLVEQAEAAQFEH